MEKIYRIKRGNCKSALHMRPAVVLVKKDFFDSLLHDKTGEDALLDGEA
jgi:hypothetical protein